MREPPANGNGTVKLPKWAVAVVAGLFTLIGSALLAWAIDVNDTQRCLLQDVSSLQENRGHVAESLKRIEDKVDRLLEIRE